MAGNITSGTDVRKQEVLDRFFRVRCNVEDSWAVKATPLVRLNVNASVSKARWSTPTS